MKTFTFGKYKGRSVIDVLNENPAYVYRDWETNTPLH